MYLSEYLSEKVVQNLLNGQYITEEHSSVYRYCIDYVLELVIFFLVLEVISIFLGNVCIGTIFFLIVVPLRSVCGGIHAPSKWLCTFCSYLCFFVTVFLFWFLQDMPDLFWKIMFILDNLFLYFIPSITHKHRCFSQMQKRKRKRFRFVFLTIVIVLFIVSSIFQIGFCYQMTALCVTIVVINMLISILVTYFKGGYSFDF